MWLRTLFICCLLISAISWSKPISAETYSYVGEGFDVPTCRTIVPGPPSACQPGSLSAIITTVGLPANYTGSASLGVNAYLTISGLGYSASYPGGYVSSGSFYISNGQMMNGTINIWSSTGGYPNNNFSSTTQDEAAIYDSTGTLTKFGYVGTLGFYIGGKTLGAAHDLPGQACCGSGPDPINIGNGNNFYSIADYQTAGQNKLEYIRYYNSLSAVNTYAVNNGQNWRSNYDRYLHLVSSSDVSAERADGQIVSFSSSGSWTTDSDIDMQLSKSGTTWTLTDNNDTKETYFSSGNVGFLQTIAYRNGYTQSLNYSSATGQLSSVSDSYGRSLGFSYSSGLVSGVTTPDAVVLSYGYLAFGSANLLSTVSYNTSPVTHQTYLYENTSFPFGLTGITDENGIRFASWSYDVSGRATGSQNYGGANSLTVSYDDTTGNRTITNALGNQDTYKFTTLQGVPKVSEIDRAANGTVAAASQYFTYDTNGYLATSTDWNGNQTAYTNNAYGDPTTIVFASGSAVTHTTTIAYDTTWYHLPKTITEPGLTTVNNYDATTGNLLTKVETDTTSTSIPYSTNGQTRTWTLTYSSTGQIKTIQLPRTDVTAKTTYAYTGGTLTSITDALSHVTTINTATSGGYPTKITDQNSIVTTLAYSPRLWFTSSTLFTGSGSLTTTLTYDSAGNLTKTTLPDSSYLSYSYDGAHRLTTVTNPLSESINYTLNGLGNTTQTLIKYSSGSTAAQHSATFDVLGRTHTDVGGVSQTTTFAYDNQGNMTGMTDPLLSFSSQGFDALNRLSGFTDPLGHSISFTYDAHDRPLTVVDAKGNTTSYVYDGFGEAIQISSPDSGITVLHYSSDGYVTSKTDANGYVTNWTYDALDRPLTRTYPADSTLNVAYTYDQTGHGQGIGKLTSLTDQANSLSLTYDERGNVASTNRMFSTFNHFTDWAYDSANRIQTITYWGGWYETYSRDAAGQVSGITLTQPSHSPANIATSITHLPFGPWKALTWGNGITDSRTYDQDYRLTNITDTGTSTLLSLGYGYDANNNVKTITDSVTAANSSTLTYNSANWLTRAISGSGGYGNIGYAYDNNGNFSSAGGVAYTVASNSNRLTAVGSTGLSYNSAGNITAIGTNSMTYNKANQLGSATVSGTSNTYYYDAFGYQVKNLTSNEVYGYGKSGEMLVDQDTSGTERDFLYLDGQPIGELVPSTPSTYYIHPNNLGSPEKVTDSSKTTVWTGWYQPFGAVSPTTSITMNLRLPGSQINASGFYRNGYRDYYPAYGRYLESDLIGVNGGLNTYAYVNNNPLTYTDRQGLFSDPVSVVIGAAIGGTAAYQYPASTRTLRYVDTAIGAIVGGGVAIASPTLSSWAGTGVSGVLATLGASGAAAGFTTVGLNVLNGNDTFDDFWNSTLIGTLAPVLSGEGILMGSGYLEGSLAAGRSLGLNTGVFTLGGTYIDNHVPRTGAPTDNPLNRSPNNSPCRMSPVFVPNFKIQ